MSTLKEKQAAYMRAYRKKNLERCRTYMREYTRKRRAALQAAVNKGKEAS